MRKGRARPRSYCFEAHCLVRDFSTYCFEQLHVGWRVHVCYTSGRTSCRFGNIFIFIFLSFVRRIRRVFYGKHIIGTPFTRYAVHTLTTSAVIVISAIRCICKALLDHHDLLGSYLMNNALISPEGNINLNDWKPRAAYIYSHGFSILPDETPTITAART